MPLHVFKNVTLQSGVVVPEISISYEIHGCLNVKRDNLVVFPTYFSGRQECNRRYFGAGRALDPERHCILVPSLIGNSDSSSPSNTAGAFHGADFPHVTIHDNVRLQRALVDEVLPVQQVALVIGWSMGGMQAYEWATQFPEFVQRLLPFCATARCSTHNHVFLEGVKAALIADGAWAGGRYEASPGRGLRAFGRAYAGWAYSEAFFNDGIYRNLGFDTVEDLLVDWERDHLEWDANDLLCKIWSWQHADVSANESYQGDVNRALGAIRARTLVIPSSTDKYFTEAYARKEAALIPGAEIRLFSTTWGHCGCTPGRPDPSFSGFLDDAIVELLAS